MVTRSKTHSLQGKAPKILACLQYASSSLHLYLARTHFEATKDIFGVRVSNRELSHIQVRD